MDTKTAGYLVLYGLFLIILGLLGFWSNPEKAKTALMSGGTFGVLSILWGALGARGARWAFPAAVTTTLLLSLACAWRATIAWRAVLDAQRDKRLVGILLTIMLAASIAMLARLIKARKEPLES